MTVSYLWTSVLHRQHDLCLAIYSASVLALEWHRTDTAIQTTGLAHRACGSNLSGLRGWVFRHFMRPGTNRSVAAIGGTS